MNGVLREDPKSVWLMLTALILQNCILHTLLTENASSIQTHTLMWKSFLCFQLFPTLIWRGVAVKNDVL